MAPWVEDHLGLCEADYGLDWSSCNSKRGPEGRPSAEGLEVRPDEPIVSAIIQAVQEIRTYCCRGSHALLKDATFPLQECHGAPRSTRTGEGLRLTVQPIRSIAPLDDSGTIHRPVLAIALVRTARLLGRRYPYRHGTVVAQPSLLTVVPEFPCAACLTRDDV